MADLIPFNRIYRYESLERIDSATGRKYVYGDTKLPSVTTILSKTKDDAKLKEWAERIGQEEANRIRDEAATVGTYMHLTIEKAIAGEDLPAPQNWLALKGYEMGYRLINRFFPNVDEIWGSEVSLYYPGKYAGTTDFVGVYRGKPGIVDYKQANKPKKRQWIEDYFHQLAAYATAHDIVHGTNINYGAVLIIPREGEPQEFTSTGKEFQDYKDAWMRRVDTFLNGSF
jgi:genome maintenance exonuclease 1